VFWQELLEALPHEKELYMDESAKRRRRALRTGKPIRVFR
jgi:hypothetical protein